jgi:hypothetical protein
MSVLKDVAVDDCASIRLQEDIVIKLDDDVSKLARPTQLKWTYTIAIDISEMNICTRAKTGSNATDWPPLPSLRSFWRGAFVYIRLQLSSLGIED